MQNTRKNPYPRTFYKNRDVVFVSVLLFHLNPRYLYSFENNPFYALFPQTLDQYLHVRRYLESTRRTNEENASRVDIRSFFLISTIARDGTGAALVRESRDRSPKPFSSPWGRNYRPSDRCDLTSPHPAPPSNVGAGSDVRERRDVNPSRHRPEGNARSRRCAPAFGKRGGGADGPALTVLHYPGSSPGLAGHPLSFLQLPPFNNVE